MNSLEEGASNFVATVNMPRLVSNKSISVFICPSLSVVGMVVVRVFRERRECVKMRESVCRCVCVLLYICNYFYIYYILKVYALDTCSLYSCVYKSCTLCVNDRITLIVNRLDGWN
ncbi:hypothetical protein Hanom_Chr00s021258g01760681 [Helianthus anomalus]